VSFSNGSSWCRVLTGGATGPAAGVSNQVGMGSPPGTSLRSVLLPPAEVSGSSPDPSLPVVLGIPDLLDSSAISRPPKCDSRAARQSKPQSDRCRAWQSVQAYHKSGIRPSLVPCFCLPPCASRPHAHPATPVVVRSSSAPSPLRSSLIHLPLASLAGRWHGHGPALGN
jgi:hypothetical protein